MMIMSLGEASIARTDTKMTANAFQNTTAIKQMMKQAAPLAISYFFSSADVSTARFVPQQTRILFLAVSCCVH